MTSKRILFVAPFPPPIGGAAKNTKIIAETLGEMGVAVLKLNTSAPYLHRRNAKYHFARLRSFVANVVVALLARKRRGEAAYVVPDGGLGLYYTLGYILLLRLRAYKIILHHRTYGYVNNYSFAMIAVILAAGANAIHIFLDIVMAKRFQERYGRSVKFVLVGNAAMSDISGEGQCDVCKAGMIIVGHLSNLSLDKGFDVVCETFMSLARKSDVYRFRLAGEPAGRNEANLLRSLMAQLGERLDYRGAVYGAEKKNFYDGLDVFVFPTRFSQEAQPNVILEAMAVGAFVVATDRGCIRELLVGTPSLIVEESPEMAEVIAENIENNAEAFREKTYVQAIRDGFAILQAEHTAQYQNLISMLTGS